MGGREVGGFKGIPCLLLFSRPVMSDSDRVDCSTSGLPVPHHLPEVCPSSCPLSVKGDGPSRITALSWQRGLHNTMKLLAMPCRATQDGWVIAESSVKTHDPWRREQQTTPIYLL